MSNRLDNLQLVFDRTDWKAFKQQRAVLFMSVLDADADNKPHTRDALQALLNWIDTTIDAAAMDGYQVKVPIADNAVERLLQEQRK